MLGGGPLSCLKRGVRMKIVLADDDPVTITGCSGILRSYNHEVISCTNGNDALIRIVSIAEPCLAILDWLMPGMTGIEVCQELRQTFLRIDVYIVLLTAKKERDNLLVALRSGVNDYITKPFDPKEFEARVLIASNILQLYREIRTLQNMLPMCAWCKRVRKDQQIWQSMEHYFQNSYDVKFTHCLCEECAKTLKNKQTA